MDNVSPGHCQETAKEGVGDNCQRANNHGNAVIETKGALKQFACRNQTGAGVEQEEQQNENCRDHPQQTTFVFKTVFKVGWQSQRITGGVRVDAQATCNNQPVQPGTHEQTYGDPDGLITSGQSVTGQAQQQPATHIRGAGRQCSRTWPQRAAAEYVVRQIGGALIGYKAQGEHDPDIDHEGGRHDCGVTVHYSSLSRLLKYPSFKLSLLNELRYCFSTYRRASGLAVPQRQQASVTANRRRVDRSRTLSNEAQQIMRATRLGTGT